MKRILLQYDIAHGRLPRPERILEQACFLKEYGLTGIMLYLDGEGAQESLPVRGAVPADYLETLKRGCGNWAWNSFRIFRRSDIWSVCLLVRKWRDGGMIPPEGAW